MAVSTIPHSGKYEITVTIGSTTGKCYYTKDAHTVTFQSMLNISERSWGAYETVDLCTLPEGFRPVEAINFAIPTNDRAMCFRGMAKTSGVISAYNPGGAVSKSLLPFAISYIV